MRTKCTASRRVSMPLPKRNVSLLTGFEREILALVESQGGFFNAHAHLDRAHTLDPEYLEHIGTTPIAASNLPLPVKQNLVGDLHRGIAYTEANLRARMTHAIERQIALGTTRCDTNIDATPDLPEDGLLAIRVASELKKKYAKRGFVLNIAPTPIFGFKPDPRHKRTRWEVFEEAAKECDYLSLLPEKDDPWEADGRIGFKQHVRRGLELARKLGKEAQFHLDQMNVPHECGTEWLLDVLDVLDYLPGSGEPLVWVIHMISPSGYTEGRFARLIERLLHHNVGAEVCPTAALSMRQLRSVDGPTRNSIARIPELIKRKIPLRLGTDNIEDVFDPQGDGDMLMEIKAASVATRMTPPAIWAKLASGTSFNNVDINRVGEMLYQDRQAFERAVPGWKAAIE